jgi:hypothetical protein
MGISAASNGIPIWNRVNTERADNGKNVITGLSIRDIIWCEVDGQIQYYVIKSIGKASLGVLVLDTEIKDNIQTFTIKMRYDGGYYIDPVTKNNLQYKRAIYKLENVIYSPLNWVWVLNDEEERNLMATSKYNLFVLYLDDTDIYKFSISAKQQDRIWFIRTDGTLISVVNYIYNTRSIIDDLRFSDEEMDIPGTKKMIITEIVYTSPYDMRKCLFKMDVENRKSKNVFPYNEVYGLAQIISEYEYIGKYINATLMKP